MMTEKYTDISAVLADRITTGEYDEKLPIASEIASEFEVNIKTAQKAVKVLGRRGLVVTRRGRGSYVVANGPASTSQTHAYLLPLAADADSVRNPWRATIMHVVEAFWEAAARKNVQLTMLPSQPERGQLPADAVVVSLPWQPPETIADLVGGGYQLLALNFMRDAYPQTCNLPFVAIANHARLEVRDAVAHLVVRGRSRLAFIEPDVRGQHLMPMLIDELVERDLPVLDRAMIRGTGETAVRELLARRVDIDALVVRDYSDALTAIRLLEEQGSRVPQDMAVLTLQGEGSDVRGATHQITYFAANFEAMARVAIDLLTSGNLKPKTHLVPKTLVAGTTT